MKNKKLKYLFLWIAIIVGAAYFAMPRTSFIISPDTTKIITLYQPPFYLLWDDAYYIIPYRYKQLLPPKVNYVIIHQHGGGITGPANYFDINWKPNKKYQIKMAFEFGYIVNKLDTAKYFFAQEKFNDYLDSGESYNYPKYASYTLEDILQGKEGK